MDITNTHEKAGSPVQFTNSPIEIVTPIHKSKSAKMDAKDQVYL